MNDNKGLQRLIERAKRAPRLSASEELECIEAWRLRRDRAAAGRVIEANLRHVVFTALKYRRYGVAVEDLISEGNVGLMKALDRFDASRNVRFATYSAYWIRAEIVMGMLDSWSLLSGPRCALDSRMFFRLRRERARMSAELQGSAQGDGASLEQRLAEKFGVSERRMEEMLAQLDHRGVSLDSKPGDGQTFGIPELQQEAQQVEGLEQRENAAQMARILVRARPELDPRETFILDRRLIADPEEKLSLGEISQHFGVSRERVRQIEVRAQQKLRQHALSEELDAGSRAEPARASVTARSAVERRSAA
ncbi:MAG: hypothetical protein RL033_3771 [Pseudomonadota bacterium]|jgi:RNA polymerase sigma-32 factor